MKKKKIAAVSLIVHSLAAASLLSGCDAIWGTSVDFAPGYYGVGINNDWDPAMPGAPLLSPVYWGGQLYPGGTLSPGGIFPSQAPPTRPGWNRPAGGSGNVRPGNSGSIPVQPSNPGGSGNVRPGTVVPPQESFKPSSVTGGQPGIAASPEGTGHGRH